MARYRVGDKYLSEQEYRQHTDRWFAVVMFLVGAVTAGIIAQKYAVHVEWPKNVRFYFVVSTSVVTGGVFVLFRKLLGMIWLISFIVGAVVLAGWVIWNVV